MSSITMNHQQSTKKKREREATETKADDDVRLPVASSFSNTTRPEKQGRLHYHDQNHDLDDINVATATPSQKGESCTPYAAAPGINRNDFVDGTTHFGTKQEDCSTTHNIVQETNGYTNMSSTLAIDSVRTEDRLSLMTNRKTDTNLCLPTMELQQNNVDSDSSQNNKDFVNDGTINSDYQSNKQDEVISDVQVNGDGANEEEDDDFDRNEADETNNNTTNQADSISNHGDIHYDYSNDNDNSSDNGTNEDNYNNDQDDIYGGYTDNDFDELDSVAVVDNILDEANFASLYESQQNILHQLERCEDSKQ
jgi:hypothetical protein